MMFCYNGNFILIKPNARQIPKILEWIPKLFQSIKLFFLPQDLGKNVRNFLFIS